MSARFAFTFADDAFIRLRGQTFGMAVQLQSERA
jgi:hypothetical protein